MKRLSYITSKVKQYIRYKLEKNPDAEDKARKLLEYNKNGKDITEEIVDIVFDNDVDVNTILSDLTKGFSIDEIKLYLDKDFTEGQITYIRRGISEGLTEEQIKYFANPDFATAKMKIIEEAMANGLSLDKVKLFSEGNYNIPQQKELSKILLEDNLTSEKFYVVANPQFNQFKMEEIVDGFNNGLSLEEVDLYANPDFTVYQMQEIKRALLTKNENIINKIKEKYDFDIAANAKIKRLVKC